MDNASSHKTRLIHAWFAKCRRWHVHFTPTSSSWINQVERFFALLSEQQIKRGTHRSTAELERAINALPGTPIQNRFDGLNPPTTFSLRSNVSVAGQSASTNKLYDNFRIGHQLGSTFK